MKKFNYLNLVISIFFFITLIIVINVFYIAVFKVHIRSNTSLVGYMDNVSKVSETIYAQRGKIYDSNNVVLAQNEETYDIICYLDKDRISTGSKKSYIDNPALVAESLAPILNMDESTIYNYLTPNKYLFQTELGTNGRNLTKSQKEEIEALNLNGIGFKKSYKRVYPNGSNSSSYFLGFAQSDENGKLVGKMGVEQYLDEQLAGIDGYHEYQQDKNGYILEGMFDDVKEAVDGYNVYLTFDSQINEALQTSLDDITTIKGAYDAWGIVVDIETGAILAAGQSNQFDPNKLNILDYNNKISQYTYEPGSTFKSFIYSATMNEGKYNGEETYNSDAFCYLSNGNTPYRTYSSNAYGCIYNALRRSWGIITFDEGFEKSSNVATSTLLTEYIGTKTYMDYVKKFGFFNTVDVEGLIESLTFKNYTWPSEKLALTYGQGSSVTTLQMVQAYTSIFGNGEMLKPYYIDRIVNPSNNEVIYKAQREVVDTPINEESARQIQSLLRRVILNGTGKAFNIDEVEVIGKTGTAEIIEDGKYDSTRHISSVIGAFPYEQPKYMFYYLYIRNADDYESQYNEPIVNFIKRLSILTNVGYQKQEVQENKILETIKMDNVLSLDSNYAYNLLSEKGLDVYILGDGQNVIEQYPLPNTKISSGHKVFLKTSNSNIKVVDFTNWTRNEVINFWDITDIPIVMDGYGIVVSQSHAVNSIVEEDEDLILYFSN